MEKWLLSEKKPDYKKVLEVALAMEAAEQNVKDLGHDDTEGAGVHGNPVHKLTDMNPRSNPQGGVTCYRCNGTTHKPLIVSTGMPPVENVVRKAT